MSAVTGPRLRASDGFTLIEVLVAVIVLGIGVVAIVTALGTHAKVSFANRNQALAESTLTAASEYVKSLPWQDSAAGIDFSNCAGGSPTPISTSEVAHNSSFTVAYGPPVPVTSGTACSILSMVPVTVDGQGFHLSVDVVKRPVYLP